MYTTCMLGAYRSEEGTESSGTSMWGTRDPTNVGALQEQIVLTAELKLSPCVEGF